jgi:tetratricopeptide (TPR) repeat protein
MTDDLYERYKEALRVGHVAVLRGALEEASAAYRTAALIAPSRALPHTSLGGVLLRLGHLDEALVEFATAVARSPRDEGALLGQAESLNATGQVVEAALALDRVSEVQESTGRLPEAADTLRRAMELDESAERGRRQRGLMRQIRLSTGDQAAAQLLARALRLRDDPAAGIGEPAGSATTAAPARDWAARAAMGVDPDGRPDPVAGSATPGLAVPTMSPSEDGVSDRMVAGAGPDWEVAALVETATDRAIETISLAGPTESGSGRIELTTVSGPDESRHQRAGDELLDAAEAAEIAGDAAPLRSLLLSTARAYAREGRFEVGLDAAHRLLQRSPGDVDAHLVLVDLYVARDWNALAVEKLALLSRLADLNNDEETRERLRAVVGRNFPRDERLSALAS